MKKYANDSNNILIVLTDDDDDDDDDDVPMCVAYIKSQLYEQYV